MARSFDIPDWYRSRVVSNLKKNRILLDPRKKDKTPTILNVGSLQFKIARHFGFCFGVENAIEIAFKALKENPGKRVFLLSEMIHNPKVNSDLQERGVSFLMKTDGTPLFDINTVTPDDVVIVPAFGTTVQMIEQLEQRGIKTHRYNATCPFVEKVWTRGKDLGSKGYTIIIHGKAYHEETRATFSRAALSGPSVVIRDMSEAIKIAKLMQGEYSEEDFFRDFHGKYSEGFSPNKHLERIGVVNQTTMLAHETIEIAEFFRAIMKEKFPTEDASLHFADTKDTLCYATEENQSAVRELVQSGGDIAVVVGGYNSSNTVHLSKVCSEKLPTFHVKDANDIVSAKLIQHWDQDSLSIKQTQNWLPENSPLRILMTAGASSPDSLIEEVIEAIVNIKGIDIDIAQCIA